MACNIKRKTFITIITAILLITTICSATASNSLQSPSPYINSISPTTQIAGTFDLSITGNNFDSGAIVQIFQNGKLVPRGTIKSRISSKIVVAQTLKTPGTYRVMVKNRNGETSNYKELTIKSQSASIPKIDSISPATTTPGTFDLSVTGSNFDSRSTVQIFQNGKLVPAGTVKSRTNSKIIITISLKDSGVYDVKVKNSNGKISNVKTLTIKAPVSLTPKIESINPSTITAGTFDLTVKGSNFDSQPIVQIFQNGKLVATGTIKSRSSTRIVVTESLKNSGVYRVMVKNKDGKTSNLKELTIKSQSSLTTVPKIDSISPSTTTAGTFDLTVKGSNFNPSSVVQIYLKSNRQPVTSGIIKSRTGSTEIVVTISLTPGNYIVKVKNPYGSCG
jgi:TATA-box binding protein (TBP) (component of TFIID and TFIIIB)